MATIVTRQTGATAKGSPLTNTELDNNFINLNNAVTAATTGPASATDNALVRFDTTTGKLVQDSLVTVDDLGKLTATSLYSTASGAYPINNFTGRLDNSALIPLGGTGLRLTTDSFLSTYALVVDPYTTNISLPNNITANSLVTNNDASQYTPFTAYPGSTWTINQASGTLNRSSVNTMPNGTEGMALLTLASGTADDGYYTLTLPWTVTFFSNQYNTLYVGTNSYITWGVGTNVYSSLTENMAATAKVMIASGDNNATGVYAVTTGTTPNRIYKIRYVGSFGASANTNTKLVWEYWIYENQSNFPYHELIIEENYINSAGGNFVLDSSGINSKLPITVTNNISARTFVASVGFQFPDSSVQTTAATNISGISNLTDSVANWAVTSTFAGVLNPTEIFFKLDGTKMFLSTGTTINQYTLSTPWDITTAGSLISVTTTWDTVTNGMFFSPDGTKLVTCGQTAVVNAGLSIVASEDRAYYLTLATAWDISSTITLVSSLRFAINDAGLPAAETNPQGITFNDTGTIMYMVGATNDAIYQYTLSTAYNVSTATYLKQLSVGSIESGPTSISFNSTGSRLYLIGNNSDNIVEYRLSTAWDIATAVVYDELYVGNLEGTGSGIFLNESSNSAYIVGTSNDLVTRFNTNSAGIFLAPALATGRIDLVGETRIKNASLYVNGSINTDGSLVVAGGATISGNLVSNNISTGSTTLTLGASASGVITIGSTSSTGAITLGQSTAAQTLNLGTGATAISTTKSVNIGTSGVSGSISNITIGSAVGGTDTTLNVTGRVAVVQPTGGIGTVTNTASSTTVTGVGTLFTRTFVVGDTITIGGQTVAISAIASDTSMTTAAITNANTTVAYTLTGGSRLVVNGNGNIGAGTTTPAGRFHIRQDQDGTTREIIHNRNATGTPLSELTFITGSFDFSDSRYAYIQSGGGSSPYISFGTGNGAAPTEKLRVLPTGAISVGATGTAYGTTGQVLTSQGNASPIWTTVSGGSSITTGKAIAMAMIFGG
jgi:hypothetical protein